jgi:hypothetical protein
MSMARESAADREAREAQEAADALAAGAQAGVQPADADEDDLTVKYAGEDGPVVLTRAGVEVGSFTAKGGKIAVKNTEDRDLLLGSLPGASLT